MKFFAVITIFTTRHSAHKWNYPKRLLLSNELSGHPMIGRNRVKVSNTGRCVPQRFTIQDPFHFNKYSQEHLLSYCLWADGDGDTDRKGIFLQSESLLPRNHQSVGHLVGWSGYCCSWRLRDAKAFWSSLFPPWTFVPWSESNSQGLPWQATNRLKAIRKESVYIEVSRSR